MTLQFPWPGEVGDRLLEYGSLVIVAVEGKEGFVWLRELGDVEDRTGGRQSYFVVLISSN